jgi:hypothetical protein
MIAARSYFFTVNVNVCPAIVNVPVRLLPVVFASAVYRTVPSSVPLDPLVIVIQLTLLTAVHAHPDCVFTATVPVPPSFSSVWSRGEIE